MTARFSHHPLSPPPGDPARHSDSSFPSVSQCFVLFHVCSQLADIRPPKKPTTTTTKIKQRKRKRKKEKEEKKPTKTHNNNNNNNQPINQQQHEQQQPKLFSQTTVFLSPFTLRCMKLPTGPWTISLVKEVIASMLYKISLWTPSFLLLLDP